MDDGISPKSKQSSLSIRHSYGARGEEILDGGGGRGRRERFLSFTSFPFSLPFFPFSPETPDTQATNKAGKLAGNSSSCCSPGLFQLLFASSFKARRYMREIYASGAV